MLMAQARLRALSAWSSWWHGERRSSAVWPPEGQLYGDTYSPTTDIVPGYRTVIISLSGDGSRLGTELLVGAVNME